VIVHHVDLSSFKSVREFAQTINKTESKIDILIHNAGYSNYFKSVSVDGIEMTMATNHYGKSVCNDFCQKNVEGVW
jgi:retinol dehydrogenase 14